MAQTPTNPVTGRGTRESGSSQSSDWDRPERQAGFGKPTGMEAEKAGMSEQIKEQAGTMMEAAKESAKDFAAEAKAKVQETVQAGTAKAAEAKQVAGEQMHTVAEKIRQGGETVSEKADQLGTYLQEHDFNAIGRDLTEVVRRYPVQALLVGVGLGILLGRAGR